MTIKNSAPPHSPVNPECVVTKHHVSAAEHLRELTPMEKTKMYSEKLTEYRGISATRGFPLGEVRVQHHGGDLPRPPRSTEPHGLR